MIEDEIYKRPRRIVDSCGWRYVISPNKDQRPINLSPKIVLGPFPDAPGEHRHECTNPEEVQEP